MARTAPTRSTVEIEFKGKKYRGTYTVTSGRLPIVEVVTTSPHDHETTQLRAGTAEALAEQLLSEIVQRTLRKQAEQAQNS